MNRIREHLSAWLVVGLLALGIVAVWGADRGAQTLACTDGTGAIGVSLPQGSTAWAPDAALAGLPQAEPGMTGYEVAEARNLARHGAADQPRFVAYNDATSLNPTRMC